MRGKRLIIKRWFGEDRITPAGAGKTESNNVLVHAMRDHPRRCGENCFLLFAIKTTEGSPPQVRGKPHFQLSLLPPLRITPAGAGKTAPAVDFDSDSEDHPRRCGENSPTNLRVSRHSGSPPQVRGKPIKRTGFFFLIRITPAGAGKTASPQVTITGNTDHPRRCGENPLTLPETL